LKKVIILFVAAIMLVVPVAANVAVAADAGAATTLSWAMGGAGEWYNNGFRGSFPWGECIVGYICCLVRLASMADAAAGKTDTKMRLDFWTPPSK
jgi:hypothetical protein